MKSAPEQAKKGGIESENTHGLLLCLRFAAANLWRILFYPKSGRAPGSNLRLIMLSLLPHYLPRWRVRAGN
jgi:hypothetical protein